MKNNKEMQNKYKRRRIAFVLIVILLIILFLSLINRNSIRKIAIGENALNIGGETLDISQVISTEPNVPVVGAGMIPIKWNEQAGLWEITTTSDSDWYNYSSGRWANVMLSDGYYKSEAQPGINPDEQIADERNVGDQIPEDQLGTIFTWIPRIAYLEDRVEFLKETNILEYMWTTEGCFNLEKYGPSEEDIGFTGIWVGQEEFEDTTELNNKIEEMNSQENIQGLIANETVTSLSDSEKTAIQKLQEKYNVTQNETMLQDIENIKNRQVIKIINVNNKLPIMGSHEKTNGNIIIQAKYAKNGMKYVADEEGNRLAGNTAPVDNTKIRYVFYIVDNIGNIRRYSVSDGTWHPYLAGFNPNTTYYVTWDEQGNEISNVPIGETAPENWYDYSTQQWANIVVRDKGNEVYYTWVPRYMYTLDQDNQKVDAKFVDLDNVWTDTENANITQDLNNTEYKLPEAFTWEDPEDPNKVIQLPGFWMNKYKLTPTSTYVPEISGGSGVIRIRNVRENVGTDYTYEMYLIKDGKRVKQTETGELEETTDAITLTGNYTFTNMPIGEYAINIIVKDENGKHIKAVANQVSVLERVEPNAPKIDSFNKNLTYYVTYDEEGNETSRLPLGEEGPSNWYDYDNSVWANIVIRENGMENYYVWVPRYQYSLDQSNQKSNVVFIPTSKTTPDAGYQIPEAFTWEDPEDPNNVIPLSGFWMNKYKLSEESTIRLNATVTAGEKNVKISSIQTNLTGVTVASYEINLIKDGKIQQTEVLQAQADDGTALTIEHNFTGLEPGTYAIELIAKDENGKVLAGFAKEATLTKIEVDLTGFNTSTTFYVAWDEQGNEISNVPIGETAPENWYDYSTQQWANIVVRDNGNEVYYTWVPRYQYATNSEQQKVNAEFIPYTKETPDAGYQIPEAFTWEDPNDETKVIHLKGFWMNKYKLTPTATYNPDIAGGSGVIRINNVRENIGTDYIYEAYLIKDGKRIVKSGDTYIEGTTPVTLTKNYVFTDVEEGNYTVNIIVKDANGKHIKAIAKQVTVSERVEPNAPNIDSFNKNLTYYVTYDEEGNETSRLPLGEAEPNNWYDYDNSVWANIVIRENGMENYYVWVPRYQYSLDQSNQKSNVLFIPTSKTTADAGYQIPEAFTWEDPDDPNNVIQLSGFWMNKYKLSEESTIRLNATVTAGEKNVKISSIQTNLAGATVASYEINLIKDGKIQQTEVLQTQAEDGTALTIEHNFTGLEAGTYAIGLIAKDENGKVLAGFAKEATLAKIEVDLTGFNTSQTFYVTWDEQGNEISNIPIGETAPEDWYDYSTHQWANIVVRDNGNEVYYTWVPRYQYATNSEQQKVNAEFIPYTKETPDAGYQIPEAFTWEDPDNPDDVIHLKGFWMNKYKLTPTITYNPDITGGSKIIRINNIKENVGADYTYEVYVIQDGRRIGAIGSTSFPLTLTGNHVITDVPAGDYIVNIMVKDTTGKHIRAIAKQVTVLDEGAIEKPDISKFNKNLTYYVTYDELGNETSRVPIGEAEPSNWYDYDNSVWANIVIRENGMENYYVWVPRYQYSIDSVNQKTNVVFIPKTQEEPDEGYQIPEAFTWEDPDDPTKVRHLNGFWMNKYKLSEETTIRLNATVAVGDNKIRISNVVSSQTAVTYTAYLIKNGKIENSDTFVNECEFTVGDTGTYAVSIMHTNTLEGTIAGFAKEVTIYDLDPPELVGFRTDTTSIVTYNEDGSEKGTQLLKDVLANDAVINADDTLASGQIDESKIDGIWYDYSKQMWANIVTINDGYTLYYTWVPRYQYALSNTQQKVFAELIPDTKEEPDEGYQIPEAFTWEDSNDETKVIQLKGFWMNKYKLTE